MTRRIVLAILALIAVLLGTVALPLGLLTAAQDRRDFTDDTKSTATALANVVEERLDDHSSQRPMDRLVATLGRSGYLVRVYDQAGAPVASTRAVPPVTAAQLTAARKAAQLAVYMPDDFVLVTSPV